MLEQLKFEHKESNEIKKSARANNLNCFKTMLCMTNARLDQSCEGLVGVRTNKNSHLFNMYLKSEPSLTPSYNDLYELKKSLEGIPFCLEIEVENEDDTHVNIQKLNPKITTSQTRIYYDSNDLSSDITKNKNIKIIEDKEEFITWLRVFEKVWPGFGDLKNCFLEWGQAYGFGKDKEFQSYVYAYDNQAIGIGSSFYNSQVCGPFNIAVAPEFQKKGIGLDIINWAVLDAREKGYRYFVGSGSPEGMKLYSKANITKIGESKRYFFN